jgi:hypothetical protein
MSDRGSRRGAVIVAGVSILTLLSVPAVVIASRPDRTIGSLEPLHRAGPTESRPAPDLGNGLALPELQVSSALVSDQQPLRLGAAPTRVRIGSIGLDARIVSVGVIGDTTEVPQDVDQVGWFRYAGRPGSLGSTLLLAHVSSGTQGPGAFFRLRELQVEEEIEVTMRDGSVAAYRVIARRMYPKAQLPDHVYDGIGRPFLTLVTCGGAYSSVTGRFEENVVVYALPIG